MDVIKCKCKRLLRHITYKTCGIAAFSFCAGTVAGLCFPITLIAFLEAVLLLIMAWMCLFQW